MRTFYLLIILGLISVMAWEFNFFAHHYAELESRFDQVWSYCK